MILDKAINHCRRGAKYNIDGSSYEGLTWMDAVQTKPTLAELEAAWVELSSQPTPTERRAAMADAFDVLSLTVQASFYAARMTAEAAMDRNRFDIARTIIEAVEVPVELEATKATILSCFP
jgi:hypothetical protein